MTETETGRVPQTRKGLVTVTEIARQMGVSANTARRRLEAGGLTGKRFDEHRTAPLYFPEKSAAKVVRDYASG
ncbi:MAG: hypothetical protein E6R03_17045, partial [Hyphomicrobiaceae bacterium]